MKKYLLTLFAIILLAGTACQEKIDIEKEKEAIMAVINAESETARTSDYDGLVSCYLQDENQIYFYLGIDDYQIYTGWDQLAPQFERFKEPPAEEMKAITFSKENPIIKVTGNTAWAICDNIWKGTGEEGAWKNEGIQITFLEKVNGNWKFSFVAFLQKPEPTSNNEEGDEKDSELEVEVEKGE
jgi:hypothetical protein